MSTSLTTPSFGRQAQPCADTTSRTAKNDAFGILRSTSWNETQPTPLDQVSLRMIRERTPDGGFCFGDNDGDSRSHTTSLGAQSCSKPDLDALDYRVQLDGFAKTLPSISLSVLPTPSIHRARDRVLSVYMKSHFGKLFRSGDPTFENSPFLFPDHTTTQSNPPTRVGDESSSKANTFATTRPEVDRAPEDVRALGRISRIKDFARQPTVEPELQTSLRHDSCAASAKSGVGANKNGEGLHSSRLDEACCESTADVLDHKQVEAKPLSDPRNDAILHTNVPASTACHDGNRRTVAASESSAARPSRQSKSAGKRRRQTNDVYDEDGDDEDEDEEGSDQPRKPSSKTTEHDTGDSSTRSLACPFYKKDPVAHWKCITQKLSKISYVTQHLRRSHQGPEHYCPNCGSTFKTAAEAHTHMAPLTCDRRQFSFDTVAEYHFQEISKCLRYKKKVPDSLRWFIIWEVLFPFVPKPTSPHVENAMLEMLEMLEAYVRGVGSGIISETIQLSGIDFQSSQELEDQIVHNVFTQFAERLRTTCGLPQAASSAGDNTRLDLRTELEIATKSGPIQAVEGPSHDLREAISATDLLNDPSQAQTSTSAAEITTPSAFLENLDPVASDPAADFNLLGPFSDFEGHDFQSQ